MSDTIPHPKKYFDFYHHHEIYEVQIQNTRFDDGRYDSFFFMTKRRALDFIVDCVFDSCPDVTIVEGHHIFDDTSTRKKDRYKKLSIHDYIDRDAPQTIAVRHRRFQIDLH